MTVAYSLRKRSLAPGKPLACRRFNSTMTGPGVASSRCRPARLRASPSWRVKASEIASTRKRRLGDGKEETPGCGRSPSWGTSGMPKWAAAPSSGGGALLQGGERHPLGEGEMRKGSLEEEDRLHRRGRAGRPVREPGEGERNQPRAETVSQQVYPQAWLRLLQSADQGPEPGLADD